jgi:hypothetical protein
MNFWHLARLEELVAAELNKKVPAFCLHVGSIKKTKLHGLRPRANYSDRATAACQRSNCQLFRIEGATW